MAQLRDKHTSAFLAEGTPLEMATLASKVGFDEVLFDDVGPGFDPQAVLDAHAEHLDNVSDEYKQQATERAKLKRGAVKAAQASIKDARDAVENYED